MIYYVMNATFEWDREKDLYNQEKHDILFSFAQFAFADMYRIILVDLDHSHGEKRYYCIGKVEDGIITVRFTYRKNRIRIIGAGYWRKGKKLYEKENNIHE